MKLSRYNNIVPYKSKYALFNAFSKKVIFIEPLLKDLLESAAHHGVEELAQVHPQFYDYLCRHEFIIDDSVDELERLKEKVWAIDNATHTFQLTINPTMNCNFKCWYCYETHIKNSRLSEEGVARILRFIQRTVEQNPDLRHFIISFFGGEPLLYFEHNVKPLISEAKRLLQEAGVSLSLHFTTNGYLINEAMIDFFLKEDLLPSFQITLDGDEQTHNRVRYVNEKKGSYREIVHNIKQLAIAGLGVSVRINYTAANIASVKQVPYDFAELPAEAKSRISFSFHRVWQDTEGDVKEEVAAAMEAVRAAGFPAIEQSAVDAVEASCYADKRQSAVINYNGDVYKCTARDFKPENRVGYLAETGEIVWEDDHLEKRMNIKFRNRPCLSCRIQPLCNGGCSQQAIEHVGEDYCVYNGDEREKDYVVIQHIERILLAQTHKAVG
jgi:uncharacterized protein